MAYFTSEENIYKQKHGTVRDCSSKYPKGIIVSFYTSIVIENF